MRERTSRAITIETDDGTVIKRFWNTRQARSYAERLIDGGKYKELWVNDTSSGTGRALTALAHRHGVSEDEMLRRLIASYREVMQ